MVGSWYLQNNLSNDLKGQVMDYITEHAKELTELRTKVKTQEAEIKELKVDIKEQNKQIADQNKIIGELKIQVAIYEKFTKVKL